MWDKNPKIRNPASRLLYYYGIWNGSLLEVLRRSYRVKINHRCWLIVIKKCCYNHSREWTTAIERTVDFLKEKRVNRNSDFTFLFTISGL